MFLQYFSINNSRRQKVVGRVAPSICVIHLRGSFYLNVFELRGGGGSSVLTLTTTNCKAYLVVSNALFTAHSPTQTGTQPTFLSTWYRTRSSLLSCQHLLCTQQLTACNGFTRTRRSSKSGLPSRRIKISLLLARCPLHAVDDDRPVAADELALAARYSLIKAASPTLCQKDPLNFHLQGSGVTELLSDLYGSTGD